MVHGLCEILKSYLATVPFADRVAGLCKPLKVMDGTVEKTIPAYFRDTKTACLTDDYVNLLPDSKLMSIMFFEDNGFRQVGYYPRYMEFEADLRLVVWWNYEKVNVNVSSPTTLVTSILKKLVGYLPNTNNYNALIVEYLGQEQRTAPYDRYTLSEAEHQYMTYPYDAVVLNFRVNFRMALDCIDLITIEPKVCGEKIAFRINQPTAVVTMHLSTTDLS